MCAVRLLLSIIFISFVFSQQMNVMDPKNYGPYKVRWNYYELCSGPKKENLTNIRNSLNLGNDIYTGVINMTLIANTRVDEMKISVFGKKDPNSKSLLWNNKVNKPCQHYAIAWILNKHFGTNSNCVIKKGEYYTIINFTDATHKFLGESFFYGGFIFKMLVLSKKGNIACVIFNSIFTKK